jgi:hypothetical protein
MSWQELAGRATLLAGTSIDGIYSHGVRIATSTSLQSLDISDPGRRWTIAFMWIVTAFAE